MAILNFGSLNIDRVFQVPRIVRPGETVASTQVATYAGGKGANQSVALASAGAIVRHAGKVGPDGDWLIERLRSRGVETSGIERTSVATGQAIIQVAEDGQNAIVLEPGANREITRDQIDNTLGMLDPATTVLTQNEISEVGYLLRRAAELGSEVCFNPAPFNPAILHYPLDGVHTLVLNEVEAAAMTGLDNSDQALAELTQRWPRCEVLLTVGSEGVLYRRGSELHSVKPPKVQVTDTTAAGDTFIGFYLAARNRGESVPSSLDVACRAAALCVTRAGAMDSIPTLDEVLNFSG